MCWMSELCIRAHHSTETAAVCLVMYGVECEGVATLLSTTAEVNSAHRVIVIYERQQRVLHCQKCSDIW